MREPLKPLPSAFQSWFAWIGANSVGELVGLGLVFYSGFALFRRVGEPRSASSIFVVATATVVLGAVEGSVVGYAQWLVLRRVLAGVPRTPWVLSTVVGAVVAWLLGMVPSTVASLQAASSETVAREPPLPVVLLLAAGMGLGGGLLLSFAQWRVLRRCGTPAGWWLPANAIAWAFGMPWIFWLVGETVAENQGVQSWLRFVAGLGVAGGIVGAIHGLFLVRFIAPKWRIT